MYFPYLRGKQYEVLAVRESGFLSGNRIVPVFEPTALSRPTLDRFRTIATNGVKFSIIVNSASGAPPPRLSATIRELNKLEADLPGAVLPAFEIRADQHLSEVKRFAQTFKDRQCILVHRNHTHSRDALSRSIKCLSRPAVQILLEGGAARNKVKSLPAVGRVILKDGFSRCARNADYPQRSDFDDLLYTYRSLGFDGFSDFSIVGDVYSRSGGPAKQVAIHLTELHQATIVTNHFVSQTPPQKGIDEAKYFNALNQLVFHTGDPPQPGFDTQGVLKYHQSNSSRHYLGLGKLKQWSIMHHIEIIDRELAGKGIYSFV